MTVLVLGSSHINSLILAQKHGSKLFNDEIHFTSASIEAWRLSPLVVNDNQFQFREDPIAVLCAHNNASHIHTDDKGQVWVKKTGCDTATRIPSNVRQIDKVPVDDSRTVNVIILIGVFPNPASDIYFDNYDFRSDLVSPERQLLSEEVFLSIEYPVTGNYTSQRVINTVTEYLGPPNIENQLQGKMLMQTVSEHYPNARKFLVGFHPALEPLEEERSYVEQNGNLIRRRTNFNSLWDCICSNYGWNFVSPPEKAMDEYRLFIRRELSLDPVTGDPHLNKEYGELLWEKLLELDLLSLVVK